MKVLILGGSRFQGKSITEELISKGHKLTIFNRGLSGVTKEHENIRHIKGDRKSKYAFDKIRNEVFDICIDTSGYNREDVNKSSKQLKIGKYIFISSTFVYESSKELITNTSKLGIDNKNGYAKSKIEAESALQKQIKEERLLIIRPSMLIGKKDHTERMTLAIKMAQKKLVPDEQRKKLCINLVDIRDYTRNVIHHLENDTSGIENITGTNTKISELWEKINELTTNKKEESREVDEVDYIPYSEDKTNNIYKMENKIGNKVSLQQTIKEVAEEAMNRKMEKHEKLVRKYLLL